MKKILAISLIAFTAVSTANAQIASKAYVDPAADGTYVKVANSTGANLTALDTQVKANTDKFGDLGGQTVAAAIDAASNGAAGVTGDLEDLDNSFGTGENAPANLVEAINTTKTEADENASDITALQGLVGNTPVANQITNGAVQSVVVAGGTNNGTVKLTVDGEETDNIAITGLGSAAYTNSNAYATAAQGTTADNTAALVGTLQGKTTSATTIVGYVDEQVSAAQTASVSGLDLAANAESQGTGNAIVSVSQEDGQLSATKGYMVSNVAVDGNGGNVITGVTSVTNGVATLTTGKVMPDVTAVTTAGHYVLTADVTVDQAGNTVANYGWELISR